MADVSVRHSAPSPTLRDKIRLFEGRNSIQHLNSSINRTIASTDMRPNSPYRGSRLSPARAISIEKDRHVVAESSRRRVPELPTSTLSSPPTPVITKTTTSPQQSTSIQRNTSTPDHSNPSPRKWSPPAMSQDHDSTHTSSTSKEKGKEKVDVLSLDYDREPPTLDSDEEGEGHSPAMKLPTLARSPRRPSIEQKYEDEVIKLKRMTSEEKQMVKALIKLTTRKNKMLDALETNIQRERQVLAAKVEVEKAALSDKLQSLDFELATKSRELSAEAMRNNDLAEKIQKLERERQDIRMALAASKRESRQCKINCDAELNKKTQSLMDMAMQLTALTCLRQSMNCIICEEKVATAVLQPCRHMVMCGPCANKVAKCPMCRVDIRSKFEIYNNWVM